MTTPKDKIPSRYLRFLEKYPDLAKAYESLGLAAKEAGPLDSKTIALVKVALSGGAMLEGAFHSHLRKASKEGIQTFFPTLDLCMDNAAMIAGLGFHAIQKGALHV